MMISISVVLIIAGASGKDGPCVKSWQIVQCSNIFSVHQAITIHSKQAVQNARSKGWPSTAEGGATVVEAPGGYKFRLVDENVTGGR